MAKRPVPSATAKKQAELLSWIFFAEVMRPTKEAGEVRWAAIRRAADAMGFDPDDQDERMFMLGVLAHILFPARVPKIVKKRGPKPNEKAKKLYDYMRRLRAMGYELKSVRGTAKLLIEQFPGVFQSQSAVEKQIGTLRHQARIRSNSE